MNAIVFITIPFIGTARKWFWAAVNKADEEHLRHPDRFCCICDGRIWPWQTSTRLYSLGMNRAHLNCGADYIRSELESRKIALDKIQSDIDADRKHVQ